MQAVLPTIAAIAAVPPSALLAQSLSFSQLETLLLSAAVGVISAAATKTFGNKSLQSKEGCKTNQKLCLGEIKTDIKAHGEAIQALTIEQKEMGRIMLDSMRIVMSHQGIPAREQNQILERRS